MGRIIDKAQWQDARKFHRSFGTFFCSGLKCAECPLKKNFGDCMAEGLGGGDHECFGMFTLLVYHLLGVEFD